MQAASEVYMYIPIVKTDINNGRCLPWAPGSHRAQAWNPCKAYAVYSIREYGYADVYSWRYL